jgi:tight adherence protein C
MTNLDPSIVTTPTTLLPVLVFTFVFALAIALTHRQSQVALRLARHRVGGPIPPSAARAGRQSPGVPRSAALARLSALIDSEARREQARMLLNRAGSPMSLQRFTRLRWLFLLLAPVLALLSIHALGVKPLGIAAAALVLITLPRLPTIYLKRLAKQRGAQIDADISDVLDLLVVCVEGGQSLQAALLQVSRRMDNVTADEFSRLLADINGGMSRRDAFSALADRCQSEALSIACTTIIHADKVGMSLAQTLRTLSDMMRTRRRQMAEARARQAPIKMMPVLVGFMLPTMLALLLGPVALEVMRVFK